ncbi:MAG TPA: hypothetical protein VFW51_02875 [Actinomycetota bacterium]|nr:hypothetical protein [Actinomycetota bacterium]
MEPIQRSRGEIGPLEERLELQDEIKAEFQLDLWRLKHAVCLADAKDQVELELIAFSPPDPVFDPITGQVVGSDPTWLIFCGTARMAVEAAEADS